MAAFTSSILTEEPSNAIFHTIQCLTLQSSWGWDTADSACTEEWMFDDSDQSPYSIPSSQPLVKKWVQTLIRVNEPWGDFIRVSGILTPSLFHGDSRQKTSLLDGVVFKYATGKQGCYEESLMTKMMLTLQNWGKVQTHRAMRLKPWRHPELLQT